MIDGSDSSKHVNPNSLVIPLRSPSPLRHHHYPSFFAPSQLSGSGQNDAAGDPIAVIPPLYRCLHLLPFLYLLLIPLHLSLPPNQNPIIILTSFPLLLPLLDLVSLLLFSLTTLASPSLSLLAPFSSLTWVALPSLQP
ncbi:hypothetical protein OIU76_029518 [Salix suchowensis]|nr:hypothetical protein OIU76_029518 [Salix suchowensis]